MALRLAVYVLAGVTAANALQRAEQQPLAPIHDQAGSLGLISELRKAEIIPTVIDTFTPLLTLSIFWENATAEVGNTVDPSKVQKAPNVQFIDQVPGPASVSKSEVQLTLALTDPDAPSRSNPEWSQICHWIATNVQLTQPDDDDLPHARFSKGIKEIMPYKPPGPPPKTGKHRYVFVALAPKNGTTGKLSLSKPGDRQHWGYGKEGKGLRSWAEENGLGVVGANFIYAQNEKQ